VVDLKFQSLSLLTQSRNFKSINHTRIKELSSVLANPKFAPARADTLGELRIRDTRFRPDEAAKHLFMTAVLWYKGK